MCKPYLILISYLLIFFFTFGLDKLIIINVNADILIKDKPENKIFDWKMFPNGKKIINKYAESRHFLVIIKETKKIINK